MGFNSKADIEKFGIENFCCECNKETEPVVNQAILINNQVSSITAQVMPINNQVGIQVSHVYNQNPFNAQVNTIAPEMDAYFKNLI